jgi:hypothetical protein
VWCGVPLYCGLRLLWRKGGMVLVEVFVGFVRELG